MSGFWSVVAGPYLFVCVLFIMSFIIGHYMFKNTWFEGDGVRILRFYEDRPSTVDYQYMGSEMFAEYPKIGDDRAVMKTSSGLPVYVVEKERDGVLVFAHIQDLSKIDFISRITAFDYARETAEEAIMERDRVMFLPKILGREYAKAPIRAILEDSVSETMTLSPDDKDVAKFMEDMEDLQSPYKALRDKYLKKEREAREQRIVDMYREFIGQEGTDEVTE